MQRPPSFVVLDPDSSSSEHEELLEFPSDISSESISPPEGLAMDVPSVLDNTQSETKVALLHDDAPSASINDQDSSSLSTDECPDVAEISPIRSRKSSDVSNKSSLSPEEVIVDPIRSSECESKSSLKVEELSRSEERVRTEPLAGLSSTESEPLERASVETNANENREDSVGAAGAQNNDNPNTSLFFRFVEMVIKITEITGHIDSSSKMVALCILLLAILIPATTICMISTPTTVTQPDCPVPRTFDLDTPEFIKHRSTFDWRQEKIEQLEAKLEKLKSALKESQKNYGECRESISEHQERNSKCGNMLKETRQMLKLKEELYEKTRSKVLELQEEIINTQREKASNHRPFLQKAFDKIFGFPTGRKFREQSKWKN